ncbi:MAG: class I SAM-dependent methyltransferase [Pseudomonadota bacterium]
MSTRTLNLDEALYSYLLDHSLREAPVLARLREETARLPDSVMQISPEQGQFMALLVELIGAERYLEIGTFTGYSALAVALALPEGGQVVACDVSEDFTSVGKPFWSEAGVAGKIDLRLAPAADTLKSLLAAGSADSFDLAFIDADKENYETYYELCLELVRPGGLILVDNVLWGGAVADEKDKDRDTEAIRTFNKKLKDDDRVSLSLLPMGDGLTMARRR